jgi:hypothetical protein
LKAPFTRERFLGILDNLWDGKKTTRKINWLEFETNLADCLNSTVMNNAEKVSVAKEFLDAYTRRGHFIEDYGAGGHIEVKEDE